MNKTQAIPAGELAEEALNQDELSLYYQILRPTLVQKVAQFCTRLFCSCEHHMLVKYELRRSTRARDIGTSREYQYVRLSPDAQYWKCSYCDRRSRLAQAVVIDRDTESIYSVPLR